MCICYICSFVVIIVNYLHDLVFFLSLFISIRRIIFSRNFLIENQI